MCVCVYVCVCVCVCVFGCAVSLEAIHCVEGGVGAPEIGLTVKELSV